MNNIDKILNDFINSAQKSRKYMENTATNYRTPLRLIIPELTDEEKNSLDLVKKNLDQIFTTLYNKNSSKLSASSIEVYKRRIRNLISDFEKYGTSPSAMANWNRPIVTRKLRTEKNLVSEAQENPTRINSSVGDAVEVGEFKLILPSSWDQDKTRQAIVKGDFKVIYEELEKLSTKLAKQPESNSGE